MELKLDEAGHVVVSDGKPVYIDAAGKEIAFDVVATSASLTSLRGEAMRHRQDKEKAEGALKAFEGIEDPAAARKALETVANLDAKRLIDAGEVEKVKGEISKSYEAKLAEASNQAEGLRTELYREKVGGAFSRSKFISENLVLPADIAETYFGRHFKIEDGKTVAYDAQGNRIYSGANPSELATFEEAIERLVGQYPHKDSILKATVAPGGGAPAGGGGGGGQKTMKSAEFNALSAKERAAKMEAGVVLID